MQLNRLIGPKGSEEAASFVIDMHNTTANTGVLLLMRKNDALGHAVANHLQDFDDTRIFPRYCCFTLLMKPHRYRVREREEKKDSH